MAASALGAMVLFAATAAAGAGTLVLHPDAVILADEIRIADLCRLEGFTPAESTNLSDVIIAPAPAVGATGVVTSAELRNALQHSGANLATLVLKGAARCDITRPRREEPAKPAAPRAQLASEQLGNSESHGAAPRANGQTLRAALESFLTADVGVAGARVIVQYGRVDPGVLELTDPPFSFTIRRTTGRRMGLVGLEAVVRDGSGTEQKVPVLVNVSLSRPAVVAARAINQGAVIGATDVQVVEMTFTRQDQLGMSESDAVIGQRAKRFIPNGQIVSAADLETVPLVKRGQIVNVESQMGGVSIVSVATAIGGGAYGDVVELRTGDRGKREFSAVVVGPGRVRLDAAATTDAGTRLALGEQP